MKEDTRFGDKDTAFLKDNVLRFMKEEVQFEEEFMQRLFGEIFLRTKRELGVDKMDEMIVGMIARIIAGKGFEDAIQISYWFRSIVDRYVP